MHSFEIRVITSSRQEIVVKGKDRRATVRGMNDAEMCYSAEDAKDVAALFAGVERLLAIG